MKQKVLFFLDFVEASELFDGGFEGSESEAVRCDQDLSLGSGLEELRGFEVAADAQ